MKIEVDVLRAEQSWDLVTNKQQNYLVVEVFGIETRVPCTEQQLVDAIAGAQDANFSLSEDEELGFVATVDEQIKREAPRRS